LKMTITLAQGRQGSAGALVAEDVTASGLFLLKTEDHQEGMGAGGGMAGKGVLISGRGLMC